MIFKSGYRRFLASKQIRSGGLTFFKSVIWAVVSTVLTLAAYFGILLLTREDSGSIPQFFYTTYFGLLYLYTIINLAVILVVLLVDIPFVCFPEISTNRWNLMTSMGIPISGLVGSKITSSIYALVRQYLMGYLLVGGCCFLMKLPFSLNYLISLFLIGVIDLILFMMIAMAISVFSKRMSSARSYLFIAFLAVQVLLVYFGFYHNNAFQADVLIRMFSLELPSYLTVSAIVIVACYAVILFVARSRSHYQELMPLGVFDIKPLVTGGETELFMTDGLRHTTILDTDVLKDERAAPPPIVEKPDVSAVDEQVAFPYGLFIIFLLIMAVIFLGILFVAIVVPSIMPKLGVLVGEGLAASLVTAGGKIVTGALAIVALALIMALMALRKISKQKK